MGRATNWAKFSASASLGVIHRGHEKDSLKLMSTYLPKDGSPGSYAEGGGLFGLGLIHANHGSPAIVDYLQVHSTEGDQLLEVSAVFETLFLV